MFPTSSIFDMRDSALSKTIKIGYFLLKPTVATQLSNCLYVIFTKISSAVTNSNWRSFFQDLISMVFIMTAYKQMIRINTSRVIAFVADMIIFRNSPIINFPRHTMGSFQNSFWIRNMKNSITKMTFPTFPFPTRMRGTYFNFAQKSFDGVL